MTWLTGSLVDNGWLTGAVQVSDVPKKIIIGSGNPVVNTAGNLVTHTYQYWFITQDDIDITNYNGQAITAVDKGTNLVITAGVGEITLSAATAGQNYRLVAFDDDESHYFRLTGTVVEV
jgi:hypothetical protein